MRIRKLFLLGIATTLLHCSTGRMSLNNLSSEENESNERYETERGEDFITVDFFIADVLQFSYIRLLPNNRFSEDFSAIIQLPMWVDRIPVTISLFVDYSREFVNFMARSQVGDNVHDEGYSCINLGVSQGILQITEICAEAQRRLNEIYQRHWEDIEQQLVDSF